MLTLPEKLLFAVILVVFTVWVIRRSALLVKIIKLGQAEDPEQWLDSKTRLVNVLADVFLQRKVLRKPVAGFFHMLIVWGFCIFAVNTINHFVGAFIPHFHMFGATVLAKAYETVADIFAVLIIIGVAGLAFRRHVMRPPNLTRPSAESAIVFASISGAMIAYLCVHAIEIAQGTLPYPEAHLVASQLAQVFTHIDEQPLAIMAHIAWWCDGILHMILVALLIVPTKHSHLIAGPINLWYARKRPRGQMTTVDLEDENAETFGVAKIEEFTWKQLVDLGACIECGRCEEFCPTHNTGKPLSPKRLIVDLKDHLLSHGPALVNSTGQDDAPEVEVPALIGGTIDTDAIWACTTCGACVEQCPMGIEHVDKVTDMRRNITLMEAEFPEQAGNAFRNLENSGNPWGINQAERTNWTDGLNVPLFADKKKADVLYWVGCSGSFDDRNKNISIAMVNILNAANIDFAILGAEERCTCESSRRLGNEYLFQTATQELIETFKQYEFTKILVTCPHCLNTLANEHPAFGGHYEVIHHAEFINELLGSGQLKTKAESTKEKTVFHDSCYLARYNNIEQEPRNVLTAAGRDLTSVPREGKQGFCCGAGGGRMWLEEDQGTPINANRAKELLESGAKEIGTSCPFCMTMVSDGVKKEEAEDVSIKDIAEIVAEQLV